MRDGRDSTSGQRSLEDPGSVSRSIRVSGQETVDSAAIRRAVVDPLVGCVLNDRFRILSVIARGGMGKVYRAEQANLGRAVALKVLSPKYEGEATPDFHKRFFLEASTVSRLTHPNTVRIFEYGHAEDLDVYYIAMEFIDGRTLHQELRACGPFPEARVCQVASQICRSLREAHGVGVVHRDLKPSNILLVERDGEDEVKVLDFGLVKDFTGVGEDLTETGIFMGSPKYMAPEQIMGQPIGPHTDVYSIGVLMYEMLSGKVPFDKGVGTLVAHVSESVPRLSLRALPHVLSAEMEAVVMKCLEKDPASRFASMRELLLALKMVAGGPGAMTETSEGLPSVSLEAALAAVHAARSSTAPVSISEAPQSSATFVATSLSHATHAAAARPSAPSPRPSRRTRSAAILGAALAMGAALVGLGVWKMQRTRAGALIGVAEGTVEGETTAVLMNATSSRPGLRARLLRVESDPPGAVVRENGRELCSTTPCQVAWRDEAASAAHRLTLERPGFRPATLEIGAREERAVARLEPYAGPVERPSEAAPAVEATAAPAAPPESPRIEPAVTATVVAGVLAPPATAPPPAVAVAAGPIPFGDGMTRPSMISGQSPVFTREAREAKVEGTMIVKCTIAASGAVGNCRVVKGLPYMNEAVLAAMATRRYTPVLSQGKPVAVDYVFNIKLVAP